jgi:hypothetical protein
VYRRIACGAVFFLVSLNNGYISVALSRAFATLAVFVFHG